MSLCPAKFLSQHGSSLARQTVLGTALAITLALTGCGKPAAPTAQKPHTTNAAPTSVDVKTSSNLWSGSGPAPESQLSTPLPMPGEDGLAPGETNAAPSMSEPMHEGMTEPLAPPPSAPIPPHPLGTNHGPAAPSVTVSVPGMAPSTNEAPSSVPRATLVAPGTALPRSIHQLPAQETVIVLGYHQFNTPKPNPYSMRAEEFRREMLFLKADGWTVVSLQDLIAYLNGRMELPEKSAVITIDDGYHSVYDHAWPVLKEMGYPWTFFVYPDYINTGGGSISWKQLEELRDAGVDIESHTKSHPLLTKRGGKSDAEYEAWLDAELAGSRKTIQDKLGIEVNALAYSYGDWNKYVQQKAIAAGYVGLFTVAGRATTRGVTPYDVGRYIITTKEESTFEQIMTPRFLSLDDLSPAPGEMLAQAPHTFQARLTTHGLLDMGSVIAAIEPGGPLKVRLATNTPQTVILTLPPTVALLPGTHRIRLQAHQAGKTQRQEASWTFNIGAPSAVAAPAEPSAPSSPSAPAATMPVPAMPATVPAMPAAEPAKQP